MRIYEPKTKADFDKYYDLRWRILRKPWNQKGEGRCRGHLQTGRGSEKDGLEGESIHIAVAERDRIPIGAGRLHFNSPGEAQIRYMAVEEGSRSKGAGSLVLEELEKRAKRKGAEYAVLDARENAVGFYEKHGYKVTGKSHTLFGSVRHFRMRKYLSG